MNNIVELRSFQWKKNEAKEERRRKKCDIAFSYSRRGNQIWRCQTLKTIAKTFKELKKTILIALSIRCRFLHTFQWFLRNPNIISMVRKCTTGFKMALQLTFPGVFAIVFLYHILYQTRIQSIKLTWLIHINRKAFLEPAVRTPVSPCLVHQAVAFANARVSHIPSDASLEEAATSVAAVDAVVLAVALIAAHLTWHGVG